MGLVINQKKIFVRVRHDLDALSLSDSAFAEKSKNHGLRKYMRNAQYCSVETWRCGGKYRCKLETWSWTSRIVGLDGYFSQS